MSLSRLNLAWSAMSPWRRRSGMACGLMAILLGLWVFLPQQPGLPPRWLCQLCAALAAGIAVLALVSPEPAGKRWHLGCAVLLLVTAVELHLSGWLLLPTKPDGAALMALLQGQALAVASLRWVAGVPGWPWLFWWLLLPFIAITLIAQNVQPALAPRMRRVAGLGAWLALLALGLRLGYFFVQPAGLALPVWVLAVLLVMGVLFGLGSWGYAALPILAGSVFGLLGRVLDTWQLGAPLLAGCTALALAVTAACWLHWWLRLPAIVAEAQASRAAADAGMAAAQAARAAAPPASASDLQAYLDAQAAQEGADKYTRE